MAGNRAETVPPEDECDEAEADNIQRNPKRNLRTENAQ
jgi:hypothetical protein